MKKNLLFYFLIFFAFQLQANDYYWVGGAGNWSDINHWATTSGGTLKHSIVPGSTDNVFFDANSGLTDSDIIDFPAGNAYCQNMSWAGVTTTPLFRNNTNFTLFISGNLELSSTVRYGMKRIEFEASTDATFRTNGAARVNVSGWYNSFSVNKPGGSLTLLDDIPEALAVRVITLSNGHLNLSNNNHYISDFNGRNTNVRSLDITNSQLTLIGTWDFRGTNSTLLSDGSYINTKQFHSDAHVFPKVDITIESNNEMTINNTVFGELTFTSTTATPGTSRIGANNTIERLEFKSNGLLRAGGNTIGELIVAPGFDLMVFDTNTITTLFQLNTPNCSGLGSITGNGTTNGTLNFLAGATIDLNNVFIQKMTATGGVPLPITVTGADGGENSGWSFQSPATGTTLYWVGGSGDWNDKNHWSTTSGGPGGDCVPFLADDVVFDQNSGFTSSNNTVTTSNNAWCHNMTWNNVPAAPIFNANASYKMEVWGNLVMDPTVTMNAKLQFSGEELVTMTTNGSGLGDFHIRIDKSVPLGGVTLVDDLINPTTRIEHSTGQWLLPGRTMNIDRYDSGSGVRTFDITNATIVVNVWYLQGVGRTWVDQGSGSFITANLAFSVRGLEYPKVHITADNNSSNIANTTIGELVFTNPSPTSQADLFSGNTIENLEFKGSGFIAENNTISNLTLAPSMEYLFTGTNTIQNSLEFVSPDCNGLGEMRGANGTTATLNFGTASTVNMENVYLKDMTATGSGVPIAVSGADAGGNSGFTITSSSTGARYWVGGTGDWNDSSHWSTTSGGTGGACIPTVDNDVYFDANSFSASGQTVSVASGNAYCQNMDWTGVTNSPEFTKTDMLNMEIWGDLVMDPTVKMTSDTYLQLTGPNSTTITTNGNMLGDFNFTINKSTGTATVSALDDMLNSLTRIDILRGGLDLSDRNVTLEWIDDKSTTFPTSIDISNATITSGWSYLGSQKSLTATDSEITASYFFANGGIYDKVDIQTVTANRILVVNSSFSEIVFSNASNTSSAHISGGNTIGQLEFKGSGFINGTGNTIGTLIFSPGKKYTLLSGSTNTVTGEWFGSGTPCNLTEISSSSTTNATITNSTETVEFDYIRLKGITADSPTAFIANEHSIDQGGNVNWGISPYNGSAPITGLGPDLALTNAQLPYTLTTDGFFGSPLSTYTWSKDGNVIGNGDELIVTEQGTYSVKVEFVDGCEVEDTIVITFASADLAIVKTVDNTSPALNDDVVFTLVATNNGPAVAQGSTVTDLLPSGYTYVSSTPPTATTYDAVTGVWTIGELAINAEVTLTITATVNATGTYENTATITSGADDPDTTNNSSVVNLTPNAPVVVTQPSCETQTGTIEMQILTDATYSIDGGITFSPTNIFPDLLPGDYSLVTKIGSISSVPEFVTINEPPVVPIAPVSDGDQVVCQTDPLQTLTATAVVPTGSTITWYDAPTGGNIVTNPVLNTVGTAVYYAETDNGTCVSNTRTAVSLVINAAPSLTIQDPDVACQSNTVDLTALTITNGNPDGLELSYFTDQAATTPLSLPTAVAVSGTYYIQGTNATTGCSIIAAVVVQFVDKPEVEVVHPDCVTTTGSINITSPLGAGFEYSIDGGVTYSAATTYDNLVAGTYGVLARHTTVSGCVSDLNTVVINSSPTTATPMVYQPECGETEGTIEFVENTNIEYSINNGAFESTYIFNLAPGTYLFKSRLVGGSCEADEVSVTIDPTPPTPAAPTTTDQQVCQTGGIQILTATATVDAGLNITWYDAATGGNIVSSPTLSSIGSITYYAESDNGICSSATRSAATLSIVPLPIIDQIADINSCTQIILPAITGSNLSGNEAYFTGQNGSGTVYNAGDTYSILGESTLYVFDVTQVSSPALSCPTEISFNVNIRETTAGSIAADQSICKDTAPAAILSETDGTGSGTLNYLWEQSTTSTTTGFTVISGATDASYAPGVLSQTTYFRRTTVSNLNGVECQSTPTTVVTITVQDTTAPVFVETLPANITVGCDAIPAGEVLTATDNLGSVVVTFTETIIPGSCAGNYYITRTWNATNDCGLSTTHIQTITIEDTTAPIFVETLPTDITISCDAVPAAAVLTATDNCGSATVSFTETSTSGSCANNYILTREWIATDACGLTTTHTQTITVEDSTAPVFVETLPTDITVSCDAIPAAAVLTATDNCGSATVSFTETSTAGSCANNYILTREWIATDQCGLTTTHTQTITVEDSTAPVFAETLPTDITVSCDAIPAAAVLTATDNCGSATVSFTETTTAGSCANNYILTREWIATDQCGLTTTHTQTITVEDNAAPVFVETLPTDITVGCDAVPAAAVLTATDTCSDATVTFNETVSAENATGGYTITRQWIATDQCGQTTSHTQIITVEDNAAPVFVEALPSDMMLDCSEEIPAAATLTASDNCGTATVTFNEIATQGNCAGSHFIERIWTATDTSGNQTVHSQLISIEDHTVPTFNGELPEDIYASCDAIPAAPEVIATDNCSEVTIGFNERQEQANACGNQYNLIREWVVSDQCGNSTTHVQVIHVVCEIQEEDIHNAVNVGDNNYDNYFKIDKIECYQDNTVRIFNRWGAEVYAAKGYNNEDKAFRGYSNSGPTINESQGLPTGNYFYVIEYRFSPDGVNYKLLKQSGFLYINNNN